MQPSQVLVLLATQAMGIDLALQTVLLPDPVHVQLERNGRCKSRCCRTGHSCCSRSRQSSSHCRSDRATRPTCCRHACRDRYSPWCRRSRRWWPGSRRNCHRCNHCCWWNWNCKIVLGTGGVRTGIAGTEGLKRPAVEQCVGVGLMGVIGLVGDRRLVPVRPVDPAGANIGGADIDDLDERHDRDLDVAWIGRGILQGRQQLLGGILQRRHLGAAGIALAHGAGIVQHQRHPQFALAPYHGRSPVTGMVLKPAIFISTVGMLSSPRWSPSHCCCRRPSAPKARRTRSDRPDSWC